MEAVKDTEVSLVQQNNGEGVGAANTGKCLGQSTTSEICDNGSVSSVDSSSISPYNRLKKNISCWKKAGADQYILSVIDNGYKIPFKETPDSFHAKNNKSARDNPDFVTKEIKNLVSKQCVSEVTEKPHIVNPLTVAYNKKGKPRLVLDCRYVNEKLHLFKFKYEDMQIARTMFEKGTYVYGFDIRGAYNHIDMFSEHRTFVGFAWQYDGKEHYCVYNSLPFGLASAGHIFTKVLRVMTSHLRSKGHNVITFLDDGLGGSTSFTKALISSEFVHQTLLELGFLLSDEKCQWKPTLTITWLGYFLNMEIGKFFIADGRIERIQESLQSMISQLQSQDLSIVPARFAASVVGQIISTQLVLGKIVRLKTRELYKCIDSRLTWESYIFMSEKAVQELVFWLRNIQALNEKGQDFTESFKAEVSMFCDASQDGYGGYLEYNRFSMLEGVSSVAQSQRDIPEVRSRVVGRVVSPEAETVRDIWRSPEVVLKVSPEAETVSSRRTTYKGSREVDPRVSTEMENGSKQVNGSKSFSRASITQDFTPDKVITDEVIGVWSQGERSRSSSWREAEAVKRVLNSNLDQVRGKKVKVYSDNKNVESILKIGSRKEDLQNIANEIFETCQSNEISLSVQWIPRESNERADYLSRCRDSDDWSVQEWVFKHLDAKWGPHTIDRFASFYNSYCARFNSRWWVPGTEAVDALDQVWGKPEINWVVPPPRLILQVLKKVVMENASCTLIVPEWPSAPYYPALQSELVRRRIVDTFVLPRIDAIKEGLGNNGMFAKEPLSFNMLAFKIVSNLG